ncbi:unnamed protein product [Oikopleura dioica]|uniref:Uncharacterized protein n=1 Tax=Oikopleura dioica TaxID=34765 RepID=E4YB02_OIKDI|nr:unnamed protein product [Oikopleura dioica]
MSPPEQDFIKNAIEEEPASLEFHSVTASASKLPDSIFQRPIEELRRKGSTRGLDPVSETPEKKMDRRGDEEQTKEKLFSQINSLSI